jgi:hypothetical protein
MSDFPTDIYTEPSDIDVHTLGNLGPLRGMAGIWQGTRGLDVKPKAEGPKKQAYVERNELQPIDPQTNGPQLLYGLRYHTHVTEPGQVKTNHDQVGYGLWEPATVTINADGTWGYEEDTVLAIRGQAEPFHHVDRNVLTKIAEPTPNPRAVQPRPGAG